ncbi:unnamed protein product [Soboliphyme baturini]|uniref:G-protein alpha subunit n=1 Tax=Soboliphyme baturini TaxID=241478 RepID=A0A183IZD6_9BILA|nr:unnamed protein product [Soboliphyme baturini]
MYEGCDDESFCISKIAYVKVLLLGSGESGKSTFLKQMVIIHGPGEFSYEKSQEYKKIIYGNIVNDMRTLIAAHDDFPDLPLQFPDRSLPCIQQIKNFVIRSNLVDEHHFMAIAPAIETLWNDNALKRTYDRRNQFQLADSCKYFFDDIARVKHRDYMPTNRDIIMCRKATRGINELTFNIQNVPFRFVDVGGQRSERQRWCECFAGITSILFLVASNEYDQIVFEDRRQKTNRLLESREVYETVVNNKFFTSVSFILFLNKTDLLTNKLSAPTASDIRKYFPKFTGNPRKLQDVQFFILELFKNVRRNTSQPFFYHFTTAIDTDNIRRVFQDCKEIILHQNLESLMMH